MFKKGDTIKVKDRHGSLVDATVLEFADFPIMEPMWWCQHKEDGRIETSVFREEDLIDWNTEKECTCGAKSTYKPYSPPGHAYHCKALE